MRDITVRLAGATALPVLAAIALLTSPLAGAASVTAPVSKAVAASAQFDPCGANQYGCYQPYGACDNYQPGCAGTYDTGIKPYDYEQNRPYYEGR